MKQRIEVTFPPTMMSASPNTETFECDRYDTTLYGVLYIDTEILPANENQRWSRILFAPGQWLSVRPFDPEAERLRTARGMDAISRARVPIAGPRGDWQP